MITDEQIRGALRAFIQRNTNGGNVLGIVKAVDEAANTCTVADDADDDELTNIYEDVLLRPVIDGKEAMTIFPKVGSYVMMVPVENTGRFMVTTIGEAGKWRLSIGTAVIEQDFNGLKISKGGDSLKQILNDLMTAIQAITVNVTAVGSPTGIPINSASFTAINTRLNNLLR